MRPSSRGGRKMEATQHLLRIFKGSLPSLNKVLCRFLCRELIFARAHRPLL